MSKLFTKPECKVAEEALKDRMRAICEAMGVEQGDPDGITLMARDDDDMYVQTVMISALARSSLSMLGIQESAAEALRCLATAICEEVSVDQMAAMQEARQETRH